MAGTPACCTRKQTGTLLCGDLFTQLGDGPALTEGDVVGPAIAAEDMFKYSSLTPGMGTTIRGLAKLAPRTLALMHGPSFAGDGAAALRRSPTITTGACPARPARCCQRRLIVARTCHEVSGR